MYVIYVNNVEVKRYKYWLQVMMYCIMNGYVYTGTGTDSWNYGYDVVSLDPRITIEKEKK